MGGVSLAITSHRSKSTTLEGLKMSKLGGVDTRQVESETRPGQVGTQPELELGSRCANCGFDHRIGHLWPLSMTAEFSNAPTSRAEVRVPRTDAAGMADALFPILSGASVLD